MGFFWELRPGYGGASSSHTKGKFVTQADIRQVLIDASNTERTLSKREVVQLVTRLTGAFKAGSVVCLHLPNDVGCLPIPGALA